MTSNTRVAVTGAGLAGVRLARRLGEPGLSAALAGAEEHTPYNRVPLAEVLAGRYAPEVIALTMEAPE
ncbi:FAD-dependent oxidoreductase [Streptomyces phaeochromogenes]|uniref:FAD-dependent oxidoreductase n=1 Tax=Streptomyces phaeochromogenes TaxID=1923 RepID=UPI0036B0AAA5